MDKTAHTSAPWRVEKRRMPAGSKTINGAKIMSPGPQVCSITTVADKPLDQKEADARLIAAAPELLSIAKQAATCVGFLALTSTSETNRVNATAFLTEIEAVLAKVVAQ